MLYPFYRRTRPCSPGMLPEAMIRAESSPDCPENAGHALRIDIAAAAIFHGMTVAAVSDLDDLSYTPPLGSPWEAVQMDARAWDREVAPISR